MTVLLLLALGVGPGGGADGLVRHYHPLIGFV